MASPAFNVGGGELVEQWLANIANKRPTDLRYDILLEIGYLLGDGDFAAYYGGTLKIGSMEQHDGVGYYVEALCGATETIVFMAIIDRGEAEFLDFVPGKWQKLLTNWYDEVRTADRKALPATING